MGPGRSMSDTSAATSRTRNHNEAESEGAGRTALSTPFAASSMSSCSQTRSTVQPSDCKWESVSRSLSIFRSSLTDHQSPLFVGEGLCSGHPCQKHPSTNTATLARLNRMSARRRGIPGSGASTRYRRPRRWSSRRRSSSGCVSRVRCRDMRRDVAASADVRGSEERRIAVTSYRRLRSLNADLYAIVRLRALVGNAARRAGED